jgi:hypothetical protein
MRGTQGVGSPPRPVRHPICLSRRRRAARLNPRRISMSASLRRFPRSRCEVPRVAFPASAAGSPWIWSQFTRAHDALVGLGDALYLVSNSPAHRQSFDDDICAVRHQGSQQTIAALRATTAQVNQAVDRVTFRPGLRGVFRRDSCKFKCVASQKFL